MSLLFSLRDFYYVYRSIMICQELSEHFVPEVLFLEFSEVCRWRKAELSGRSLQLSGVLDVLAVR